MTLSFTSTDPIPHECVTADAMWSRPPCSATYGAAPRCTLLCCGRKGHVRDSPDAERAVPPIRSEGTRSPLSACLHWGEMPLPSAQFFLPFLGSEAVGYTTEESYLGLLYEHRVKTGSVAHSVSYSTGSENCFPGNKAVGKWSWQLTLVHYRG